MLISLFEGFALVRTDRLNVDKHSHSALQLTLALSGQVLKCGTEADGIVEGQVILIPPLTTHCFHEDSGDVLVFLIDNESIVAESLKERRILTLDPAEFQELLSYIKDAGDAVIDPERINQMLFGVDLLKNLKTDAIDARIKDLVSRIRSDESYTPSAEEAARSCFLSESRFLHLFKEEMGLPFRKYLQWIKFKRALESIRLGRTLTEAAYVGGFSDSSHLSRFFTDSFGIKPSEVFKNSRFMQVE